MFSRAPHAPSPPLCNTTPPHPFCATLGACFSSSLSLGHTPSSLPTFREVPPLSFWFILFFSFLLFFSLLPLTSSLLLAGIWDPPLAGKCEGGLSPFFHTRPLRPSSAHKRKAHTSSFFLFISFSFADRLALLFPPFVTLHLCHVTFVASLFATHRPCLYHMSPCCVTHPFATCHPVASPAPSPRAALLREG